MDWMNNTPRGKYLEWQFRRCDSVIWCISAKRIGSAASSVALKYFSAYSKKIVLALTSVDLVAKAPKDIEIVMNRARQLYGPQVADICAFNGKAAWGAIDGADQLALEASGYNELVRSIDRVCISQGNKVRNLSRYHALRRTEAQYRSTLAVLAQHYSAIERQYRSELVLISEVLERSVFSSLVTTDERLIEAKSSLINRTDGLGLLDDAGSVRSTLQLDHTLNILATAVRGDLQGSIAQEADRLARKLEPYTLPSFDADGEVAGTKLKLDYELPRISFQVPHLRLLLEIDARYLKEISLVLREFFGSATAKREREDLLSSRRDHVRESIEVAWVIFELEYKAAVENEVRKLFERIREGVTEILETIEREVGCSLEIGTRRIELALERLAVEPAVLSGVRRAITRATGV